MRLFLLAAFVLLAALFWVASGGGAFDPPERAAEAPREAAPAAPALPEPAPLTQVAAEPDAGAVRPDEIAAFDRAVADAETAPLAPAPDAAAVPDDPASDPIEEALGEALGLRTVAGSRVNLRGGPGTEFDVVGQLDEGARAEVLQDAGGWAEVRTADGATGWMASRFLE